MISTIARRRVLAATVVWLLAACGSDPPATSSDDPAAAAAPSAEDVRDAPPDTMVALTDDAVVEVDRTTGSVRRRHPVDPGAGLSDLAYVDVHDTALVTRRLGDDRHEIVEVSLLDGTTRVLLEGADPAVSGDGRRLAFTRRTGPRGRLELVVATWDGTEERVWRTEPADGERLEITGLDWAATGEELALALRSSAGREVRVLPTHREGTLRGASDPIHPSSAGAVLTAGVFRRPGVVTVAEGCCEHRGRTRWRLLDVTVDTGSASVLATGLRGPVGHLDWTADQGHLAVTVSGAQPPTVLHWSHQERAEVMAGPDAAEW